MNRLKLYCVFISAVIVMLMFGAQLLPAQAGDNNRVTVPLMDPSRPARVRVHLLSGGITVKAYEGKDVIVEAKARGEEEGEERPEREHEGNLRRIPMNTTGLNIEAENNQVNVSSSALRRMVDITVTVPVHTSLSLHTVNSGNIVVTGVDGELDVNDINGQVTLKDVSGSAVAHALNGRVLATFTRVDPQKPMAFSSMNGDIDVTFPSDIKATLSMRTDNGEVYSDFNIQLQSTTPRQTVEDGRGKGGKYVVRMEKTVKGTINGGGQEIQLKNFNWNIYIRKTGGK